jgi:hypothetical protein
MPSKITINSKKQLKTRILEGFFMNIKKSLIALMILNAGAISASDKQRVVGEVLGTLIATPIVAAGLVGLGSVYRRSAFNPYGYFSYYTAGPLGTSIKAERLALDEYENHHLTAHDDQMIKKVVSDKLLKGEPGADAVYKLNLLHKSKGDFLRDTLPKEFKKQAFLRNFVAITVGKSLYDLYQASKK